MRKRKRAVAASANTRLTRRSTKNQRASTRLHIIAETLIETGLQQSQDDHELALECFKRAAQTDPRSARAWQEMAQTLLGLGRWAECIEAYETTLAIDPAHPFSMIRKGYVLMRLGRHQEGIDCFDTALKKDPQNHYALEAQGFLLFARQRFEEAIVWFDRAIDAAGVPFLSFAWRYKVESLTRMGRYQDVLDCCDKAIEADPAGSAHVWCTRGFCLHTQRRFEAALRCYEHAVAIEPGNSEGWVNKAILEHGLGRTHDAVRSYRHCLTLALPKNAADIALVRRRLYRALREQLGGEHH